MSTSTSSHVSHDSSKSDQSPNASAPVPPEDCLACKLVGGGAFSGLGVYSLVLAQRQGAFQRVRPPGGSMVGSRIQAVLGVGFIAAGIGRLLM